MKKKKLENWKKSMKINNSDNNYNKYIYFKGPEKQRYD